jgi:phosphoglycolate phosphatase-like HAD superfamily hydrolase
MDRALAARAGRAGLLDFRLDGMTDRLIVRTALRHGGLPEDEATIRAVLDAYVGLLSDEMRRCDGYAVMPGVVALLETASRLPHVAVGLGTGNVSAGARLKLEPGRLNGYFAFGGFGDTHEDRVAILREGQAQGAALLGCSPGACRTVVIGDTPRDIRAARALGAIAVGVATGSYGVGALRDERASIALPDLAAGEAIAAILGPTPDGAERVQA